MSCCIVFGSILGPFSYIFPYSSSTVFSMNSRSRFFWILDPPKRFFRKMGSERVPPGPPRKIMASPSFGILPRAPPRPPPWPTRAPPKVPPGPHFYGFGSHFWPVYDTIFPTFSVFWTALCMDFAHMFTNVRCVFPNIFRFLDLIVYGFCSHVAQVRETFFQVSSALKRGGSIFGERFFWCPLGVDWFWRWCFAGWFCLFEIYWWCMLVIWVFCVWDS